MVVFSLLAVYPNLVVLIRQKKQLPTIYPFPEEDIQPMFTTSIFPYGNCSRKTKKAKLFVGICLILLLVAQGGYAMQPPPPPLSIEQLKMLIVQADLIVVGNINTVNITVEAEETVEATLSIEKLLKGKVAEKTIVIKETYKTYKPQLLVPGSGDKGDSKKMIVSSIAGPSTYHGKYIKDARILVLLEKIGGTDKYRPLGSGTYDKHLCEFLIEDEGIKAFYFKFAEDVGKYAENGKQFIGIIKMLIKCISNKEESDD